MANKRLLAVAFLMLSQIQTAVFAGQPEINLRATQLESVDIRTHRIEAGDSVSITVFPVSEYSKETTVATDGSIELQLLGNVSIKGLTASELQGYLEERYRKFVSGPKITVNVRRFVGRRVAILGEVKAGGYFEYRDGLTILDLISLSGGLGDNAKASKTKIIRQGAEKPLRANLKAVLAGDPKANIVLLPGDTVIVPKGRLVQNTSWITANILPWATIFSVVASLVVINKQL